MKIKEKMDEKKLIILLGVALVFSCLIVFFEFIFGDNIFMFRDVGSDTYEQYYPYYVILVSRIKSGNFGIWNTQHALGTSILNNLSQTFDPFGGIIVIIGCIGGTGAIKYGLVFVQIIKIIVAAYLCRYFLKIFNISEMSACLGGFLYGFSGYLILWGQHYFLGTASIYLLLILIFLEKNIREDLFRWKVFLAISVFLSIMYSYYTSYMVVLFCAIYFLFRIFYPGLGHSWYFRINKSIETLIFVVMGLMMAVVVLLPATAFLFNSSMRMGGNDSIIQKFLDFFFMDFFTNSHIGQAASRLMSNNMLYINEGILPGWGNYYEMPNIFYTVFIFILFAQFVVLFLKKTKDNFYKTLYYILCIIAVYMIMLNPGVSMAFNGFVYPIGRYLFVLIPVFALMVAYVLDECIQKSNISILGIIAGVLFSGVVIIYSYRRAAVDVKSYSIIYGIFILIFAGVLLYIKIKKNATTQAMILLLTLFAVTSVMDARITNNQRETLHKSDFEVVNGYDEQLESTKEAVNYLMEVDDSVYRIEKDYTDLCYLGDPLLVGYSSVTDYNSTINQNVYEFYNYLYSGVMPSFSIRVFNLNNPTDIVPMQLINLKYILSKEIKEIHGFEYFDKKNEIYIYKNIYSDSIARWYEQTISKDACSVMSEEDRKNIVLDTAIVEVANDTYKNEKKGEVEIGKFIEEKNGNIIGSISNSQSGILMLSIPDQEGWNVYVDGIKRETMNINYGFIGVEVEPGEHQIRAVYTIPFLKEGCLVSSFAGIILIFMFIKDRYKKRR